jgi:acyl carrier protein
VSETQHRLIRCFRAVFPELNTDRDALEANVSSVAAWDSLATVILAAAVEEEFGVQVEPEEIEKLTSFQSYLTWLARDARTTSPSVPEPIVAARRQESPV